MGMFFFLRLSLASAGGGGERKMKVKGKDEMRIAADLLDWERESATTVNGRCLNLVVAVRLEFESAPPP